MAGCSEPVSSKRHNARFAIAITVQAIQSPLGFGQKLECPVKILFELVTWNGRVWLSRNFNATESVILSPYLDLLGVISNTEFGARLLMTALFFGPTGRAKSRG